MQHNLLVMADIDVTTAAEDIHRDGGYASRKLWMAVFAMGLIVLAGVLSGLHAFAGFAAGLPVVVGGIIAIYVAFAGANVATKWTAASVAKAGIAVPEPEDPPTK